MSVLLLIVGAIVTMAGVAMVGYGIPINEFSFGNTLIMAGTTATVGGLVIVGIALAVGKIQRIVELLAARSPLRSNLPLEMFEPPAGARATAMPGQVPFPARPKSETGDGEPQLPIDAPVPAGMADEDRAAAPAAPTLQNPDMPVAVGEQYEVEEYEIVSLSPQQPKPAPVSADLDEFAAPSPVGVNGAPMGEKRSEPAFDAPWHFSQPPASPPPERQPRTSYFDAMWPTEPKPAKRPVADEAKPEPPPSTMASTPKAPVSHPASEPPVAILKSGVVDGMGYTLYVDGSIEAELPQGTLHFASINDLRDYLAKH